MKCKEYDELKKQFETAIAMFETLKRYDLRITNVLYNIDFEEERKKLLYEYELFQEKCKRGNK